MCFSPTNTTRKICDAVALGMGSEDPIVLHIIKWHTDYDCDDNALKVNKFNIWYPKI